MGFVKRCVERGRAANSHAYFYNRKLRPPRNVYLVPGSIFDLSGQWKRGAIEVLLPGGEKKYLNRAKGAKGPGMFFCGYVGVRTLRLTCPKQVKLCVLAATRRSALIAQRPACARNAQL